MPRFLSVFTSRYKTVLCRHLRKTGRCEFGSACVYAHGTHELRSVGDNIVAVVRIAWLAKHQSVPWKHQRVGHSQVVPGRLSSRSVGPAIRALESSHSESSHGVSIAESDGK